MSSKANDPKEARGYVAHTPPENQPDKWQSMREHTTNVAEMAARFAALFGAEEVAKWAGWLHDVGKYSDAFQGYLRECDRAKREGRAAPKAGSAEHKVAGTKLAWEILPPGIKHVIAPSVLGHHGGLNARAATENAILLAEQEASSQLNLDNAIERARQDFSELTAAVPAITLIPAFAAAPSEAKQKKWHLEMLTRFVFSCLVDADALDTERHFSEEKAAFRSSVAFADKAGAWLKTLQEKQATLQAEAERKSVNAGQRTVNRVRREVYEACLAMALKKPGVYTLTVPTGGGKTRSALAFALAHAEANSVAGTRRSRIIYAAPYTSIIDQTADVFREILGSDAVLEHHSAVEARHTGMSERTNEAQTEDAQEQQRRLAAENWDVPLIVTTTVQLLESLFSNRTSRCRKLHNIARSIIILDEVQTLPPHLLAPLLSGLRALVVDFGVTLLLCTATQPAFEGNTPYLQGLPAMTPIIADPEPHFRALKRVTYRIEPAKWTWDQVAQEMRSRKTSCLAVLNTKRDALALLATLQNEEIPVFHLSTLLCGAHRRKILAKVRAALLAEREDGASIFLVSTQVIEAGVNIDVPCVLRARGPLDRIIQSAGRCNREGRRSVLESKVIIFDPEDGGAPPGDYRAGIDTAFNMITSAGGDLDFDSPQVATEYFAKLYHSLGKDRLDKRKVQALRLNGDFPEVAKQMRLIDDDTVPVLVPYHHGKFPLSELLQAEFEAIVDSIRSRAEAARFKKAKGKIMTRELWQRVQPYTVAVYEKEIPKLPVSELVPEQLYLWGGKYDEVVGVGDSVQLDSSDLVLGSPSR